MAKDEDDFLFGREEGEESGGEGSRGGSQGDIEFHYRDPLLSGSRDDLLSPQEKRRLDLVHKDLHKGIVDKQKATRKERQAMKEGKPVYAADGTRAGKGYGKGHASPYAAHPELVDKPQWSGAVDNKVSTLPNQNDANTNEGDKNKLDNRPENRLTNTHRYTPGSAPPRPMGPGGIGG